MNASGLPSISVVTPSYRQAEWLRLCAASVADQVVPGLEIEHIVQDALTGPEVVEALRPFPQVHLISEKDDGMYDAINRGWAQARGDIVCWLNCDEQYQPGTLARVAAFFRDHPDTDVLFGDVVVVDENGAYRCSRQVLQPQLHHTWVVQLATWSCATFLRRSLVTERGFTFDPRWRVGGDGAWMVRLLRAGVRTAVMRHYLSAFVDSGDNLGLQPRAVEENRALAAEAPEWVRGLRPLWIGLHRLRRMMHGLYRPRPFSYEIYTPASPRQRVRFDVPQPTFYWKTRMNLR